MVDIFELLDEAIEAFGEPARLIKKDGEEIPILSAPHEWPEENIGGRYPSAIDINTFATSAERLKRKNGELTKPEEGDFLEFDAGERYKVIKDSRSARTWRYFWNNKKSIRFYAMRIEEPKK